MSNERLMYGSIGAAILSGTLLLILLGWIPFYGWIIAGFTSGIVARGTARGFISALISGVIVSIGIILMALFLPYSDIAAISSYLGNSYLNANAFPYLYALLSNGTLGLVKTIAVDYISIPVAAGLIGGSVLTNGYYVVESQETEAPAEYPLPAPDSQGPQAQNGEDGEQASKIA